MPMSKEPLCRKNPDFYSIECMDLPQHTGEYINDPSCTSNSDPEFTSLPSGSGSFCRALFEMSPWWNYISLASFIYPHCVVQSWASLVAQQYSTHLPVQEMRVWSLGREDPLEEEMQPTPVFLPGKSHGQRSLVGYSPWGHTWLSDYNISVWSLPYLLIILHSLYQNRNLATWSILFDRTLIHQLGKNIIIIYFVLFMLSEIVPRDFAFISSSSPKNDAKMQILLLSFCRQRSLDYLTISQSHWLL